MVVLLQSHWPECGLAAVSISQICTINGPNQKLNQYQWWSFMSAGDATLSAVRPEIGILFRTFGDVCTVGASVCPCANERVNRTVMQAY